MSLLGSILHCGMDFTPFVSGLDGRVGIDLDGVGGGQLVLLVEAIVR